MHRLLLLALVCCLGMARAQEIRADAVIDTAKMRIGEQAHIDLYLSYDANSRGVAVQWPSIGDTLTGKVEVVNVSAIDTTFPEKTNSSRIFQHQQITISVYDSGYFAIPGFHFTINNDSTKQLVTRALFVEVHTVPTDTSLAKTKDIKTVLNEPFNWKWYLPYLWWALAILLLAAIIVGIVIWYRRRNRKAEKVETGPRVPAHVTALAALERIREEQVWKNGQVKEYYSSISETVRAYIEARFSVNALESTTDEIMTAFRSQVVDPQSLDKLRQLLTLSDLVKFAKLTPIEHEHTLTLQNAFDFVNGTTRLEDVAAEQQPAP